jgi:hypothetical protein
MKNTMIAVVLALTQIMTSYAIDLLYTEWGTGDVGILDSNKNKSVYATTSSQQSGPFTTDAQGNLFISDSTNQQIIRISSSNRSVATYASGGLFNNPSGLAFDGAGNLYVSNYAWTSGTTVLKVDSTGSVSVFANILGGGSLAYNNISSEIFVGNYFNSIVNNINLSGGVSTFKNIGGTGNANSILFDNSGNFYFSTQGYGGAIPSISKVNSGGETSLFWDAGSNDGSYLGQIVYDQNQNEFYAAYGTSILKIDSSGNSSVYAANVTTGGISGLAILPEPSALSLVAVGLGGLAMMRRRS